MIKKNHNTNQRDRPLSMLLTSTSKPTIFELFPMLVRHASNSGSKYQWYQWY